MFITPHIKRLLKKSVAPFHRIGLKNRDCSIISNNCFSGFVYDLFGLPYYTPTIGMYFFPDEYIKFITNLKHYLSCDLEPLAFENSKYQDELVKHNNNESILGKLDDIEIVLLHHHSFEEAKQKWRRRADRVNYNNIVIKFNDQNGCLDKHYDAFIKTNYEHKLFFTANKNYMTQDYCYFIKKFEKEGVALDDLKSSRKVLNYKKYLNGLLMKEDKND